MQDINKAYQWAIETCNAPNIGYSQPYRNQHTVKGITYYDCSSFIWYALLAGGFDVKSAYLSSTGSAYSGNAITTAYEKDWLTALNFAERNVYAEWLPGDILWRSGHTEMVYSGGQSEGVTMGAHSANYPLNKQVSINTGVTPASKWESLYRYGSGGASGYGYSIYVIAALCGNAWRESHINPGFTEVGGGGYGLFQWTGERRTKLENWLINNGYALDSPDGQLQYLVAEDDWIQTYGEYPTLTDFLNSDSTDIAYLTECFMRCWERPGVPALAERIIFANKAYTFILNHANDTTISNWIIKTDYLTEAEALNNAVMMYRFYSAGGGGGGTDLVVHNMPVWMMLKHKINRR